MSSPRNETPVYPPYINPVRDGVYKVRLKLYPSLPHPKVVTRWSRWQNGQWHLALTNPRKAAETMVRSSDCYKPGWMLGWMGLSREPK